MKLMIAGMLDVKSLGYLMIAVVGDSDIARAEREEIEQTTIMACVNTIIIGPPLRIETIVKKYSTNTDIVLAAVKQNGDALGYASEELLGDR